MNNPTNNFIPVHIRKNDCSLIQFNSGAPMDLTAITQFKISKTTKKTITNESAAAVSNKSNGKESTKNSSSVLEEVCIDSKLKIDNTIKKFSGIDEKMVMSNSSYFILCKNHDGSFDAYPISDWYKMKPCINYRTLNAEEAEQEFLERSKRDAVTRQMIRMKMNTKDLINDNEAALVKKEKNSSDNDDDDQDNNNQTKKDKPSNQLNQNNDDDDDDNEYIESREVDYMSDSTDNSIDAMFKQEDDEPNKIPDDDLNAALPNDNKYADDNEDSDIFEDVSEDSVSNNDNKNGSKGQSRKRPMNTTTSDNEDDEYIEGDDEDDEDDDEDDDDDDDDDDNFDDLEKTYSNVAFPSLGDGDNLNPELENLVLDSDNNINSLPPPTTTSTTTTTTPTPTTNPTLSDINNLLEKQAPTTTTTTTTINNNKPILSKNELEKTIERLVIASLKGNSVTSSEVMQKVTDGLSMSIPKSMLVKYVGNAMKKCKFTRRVVNNTVYFSLK